LQKGKAKMKKLTTFILAAGTIAAHMIETEMLSTNFGMWVKSAENTAKKVRLSQTEAYFIIIGLLLICMVVAIIGWVKQKRRDKK
jgi:hypothetical protein